MIGELQVINYIPQKGEIKRFFKFGLPTTEYIELHKWLWNGKKPLEKIK